MVKTLLQKVLLGAALIACAYLGIVNYQLTRARAKEAAAKSAALAEVARLAGAKPATVVKTVTVTNTKLVPFLKKAAATGGTPVEHQTTTATISDKESAAPTATSWDDPHHRFHLELPSGVFTRQQIFKFESVVVRAPDGKQRFIQSALTEYDPVTKQELPGTGITLDTALQVVNEKAETPGVFHPRIVAAFDQRAAVGVGLEFVEFHQLDLSVLGFYDRKTGKGDAALHLGYRLTIPGVQTNLAIGPYWSPINKQLGAAVTIQVTR